MSLKELYNYIRIEFPFYITQHKLRFDMTKLLDTIPHASESLEVTNLDIKRNAMSVRVFFVEWNGTKNVSRTV